MEASWLVARWLLGGELVGGEAPWWRDDRIPSKQRARNVPLASADVRGKERSRDDPKECLRRSLSNN